MRKIPTLLKRNPEKMSEVLPELNPDVDLRDVDLIGTPKWDGTCVMFDGEKWWARREVKPDKEAPADFVPVQLDENTGKTQGWVPVAYTPDFKWINAAIQDYKAYTDKKQREAYPDLKNHVPKIQAGTYEAVGIHFQGDPHDLGIDTLVPHGWAHLGSTEGNFVESWFQRDRTEVDVTLMRKDLEEAPFEGLVLYDRNSGVPVAKIKRRDFGLAWPREVN